MLFIVARVMFTLIVGSMSDKYNVAQQYIVLHQHANSKEEHNHMATINYTDWYLTLPVDASGGITGEATTKNPIGTYSDANMFWVDAAGWQHFKAPVNGATTSGSVYPRSELREMIGGALASWTLTDAGEMINTIKVIEVPTKLDGTVGKVVIGQIHGPSDELCRMYWDNGEVYFKNDLAGPNGDTETKFQLLSPAGAPAMIPLNTQFKYKIRAKGHTLSVYAYYGGVTYSSVTTIHSVWDGKPLYFKAGVYLGQNETTGTGNGHTAFSIIGPVSHGF